MSKLARALALVAMLAAMNLATMTAVAHAHTSNDPASTRHRALGRVEFLATDQPSRQADATVQRLLANERSSIPDTAPAHPRLLLDEERSSLLNLPNAAPAQATSPVRPARAQRAGRLAHRCPGRAGRRPSAGRRGRGDGRPAGPPQPTRRADGLSTSVHPDHPNPLLEGVSHATDHPRRHRRGRHGGHRLGRPRRHHRAGATRVPPPPGPPPRQATPPPWRPGSPRRASPPASTPPTCGPPRPTATRSSPA